MTTQVDVLIIGAGASGAAVAWSLAKPKMHIVCLCAPNHRGPDTDYPINAAATLPAYLNSASF
jgi:glycine/D-amino acid oxidase-like deaminating enzyme